MKLKPSMIAFLVLLLTPPPVFAAEKEEEIKSLDLETLAFELPTALQARAEMARLVRPEFLESLNETGLQDSGVVTIRGHLPSSVSVYQAWDGTVYLADDADMALWVRRDEKWTCLVSGLSVEKTFGGVFPWLPVRYLGNGLFAVSETVPGEVLEKSKEGYPQARAVTFLIDSRDGKVKGRSKCFIYDHNPPIRIPEEWKKRYNITVEDEEEDDPPASTAPASPKVSPP